jgi:hypothetical protein
VPDDGPVRAPVEVLDTRAGRDAPRSRRTVLVLVLVAALLAGVAVLLTRTTPASGPRPSPTAPAPAPSDPPTATRDRVPTRRVVLRQDGPTPALGTGTLYLRSADTVFRVELGTGRVTATPAPVTAQGPVSFVAGPTGVLVRPLEDTAGLLVPDAGAARPLRGLLRAGAQVLPASRGRLWVGVFQDGRSAAFVLTSFDGTPTWTSVREDGYFLPDGTGGLLLVDPGGVYELVRGRWRRLAVGTALATGPRYHLLATCSGTMFCETVSLVRHDRQGKRPQQPVLEDLDLPLPGGGSLSADGRFLVTPTTDDPDAQGDGRALVLELDTGRVLKQMVVPTTSSDVSGVAAWSSDGRRLVGLDQGQLFVLDLGTGATTRPDLGLPAGTQLVQLALRSGTAR